MHKYRTFFSSFSWLKGYGALVGSLIMAFSISILFKSYFCCQLSVLHLQPSMDAGNQITMLKDTSFVQKLVEESSSVKPICNPCNCEPISNYCEIKGDVTIEGISSSIYIVSSGRGIPAGKVSSVVKPYVRKENAAAMDLVKTDNRPWWITKFQGILRKLSRYDIIDIDREGKSHCYPSIIIGLKYHHELGIDQSKSGGHKSMKDFRQFLRRTYSLKRRKAIRIGGDMVRRPRLLIISRRNSRSFTNIDKMTRMAGSLGYNVVTMEPNISTSLASVAQTVNSCDVLMGIHGAGLTNMVFLPDNAILIQIVPLGSIDGLAREDFAEPAIYMNLRYLEYKIRTKESSLINKYQLDHLIVKDPLSVHKQGWNAVRSIYLDKQNVKLDVRRFRTTLIKALQLLCQ